MSSGIYLGESNVAHSGTKGYIGINDTAHTILKAYVGDSNSLARLAYQAVNIPLKTFSQATEAELVQMVQAADAGLIDLYDDCGWRVGQERSISIAAIANTGTYDGISWSVGETQVAQTATLVLMNKGGVNLVTPVKAKGGASRSQCSFVAGLKNSMRSKGYMYSASLGLWRDSDRRKWCNGGFRQALSSDIRTIFKQFTVITGSCTGSQPGGSNITTQDYFTMPAEKEIYGNYRYSTQNEASALSQFTWYVTEANRIKKLGDSGSADGYYERSPYDYNSRSFCAVNGKGTWTNLVSESNYGISPFGCI